MLRDVKGVEAWLSKLGIHDVIVVSPHLDDAVYSVAGFLSAAPDRSEVITVLTEGQSRGSEDWARMCGFSNSLAEHRARRQEDTFAMNSIGCRFQHLGLRPGDAIEASVSKVVKALEQARPGGLGHTLVLLPAGAGGPPPRSRIRSLALRCIRRPIGCIPHGEHLQVRDVFWRQLAGSQAHIGFYAELPYAWAQSDQQLQQHLHSSLGSVTRKMTYRPDREEKGRLVELYKSQLVPIFGRKPSFRKRVLNRRECVFMVEHRAVNQQVSPIIASRR